jgi:hypothetical protein
MRSSSTLVERAAAVVIAADPVGGAVTLAVATRNVWSPLGVPVTAIVLPEGGTGSASPSSHQLPSVPWTAYRVSPPLAVSTASASNTPRTVIVVFEPDVPPPSRAATPPSTVATALAPSTIAANHARHVFMISLARSCAHR